MDSTPSLLQFHADSQQTFPLKGNGSTSPRATPQLPYLLTIRQDGSKQPQSGTPTVHQLTPVVEHMSLSQSSDLYHISASSHPTIQNRKNSQVLPEMMTTEMTTPDDSGGTANQTEFWKKKQKQPSIYDCWCGALWILGDYFSEPPDPDTHTD